MVLIKAKYAGSNSGRIDRCSFYAKNRMEASRMKTKAIGKTGQEQKTALPKEEWLAAAQRIHATAFTIAKWMANNPEARGLQDTENIVTDMQLACQAMRYVAENASDECLIIPMPKG